MKRTTPFIAAVIVAIIVVSFLIYRSNGRVAAPLPLPATATSTTYVLAEVARHGGASSCWTAISGGVYDLTSWIDQHPGGAENILLICGKDGTAAFLDQHGGQRRPEAELASFKIGSLAK